jgi:hypothetical protein
MNDQPIISADEAQKYDVPLETLLAPQFSHRYRCPVTGNLRSPEDVNANEKFWKNLGKPAEIKAKPS